MILVQTLRSGHCSEVRNKPGTKDTQQENTPYKYEWSIGSNMGYLQYPSKK